jgi:hypothetical protein
MRNTLAALAVLAILIGVGFYAAGWITYRKDDTRATIEIKTDRIEAAGARTVEQGRDLLEDIEHQPVKHADPPAPPKREVKELDGPVTSIAGSSHVAA